MSDASQNASKRAKAAAASVTRDLEARLEALRAEMDDVMKTLAEKAEQQVSEAADVFSTGAGQRLVSELRETLDEVRQQARDAEKKISQTASDHPLQTVLVAFGLGYLVSLFLRR